MQLAQSGTPVPPFSFHFLVTYILWVEVLKKEPGTRDRGALPAPSGTCLALLPEGSSQTGSRLVSSGVLASGCVSPFLFGSPWACTCSSFYTLHVPVALLHCSKFRAGSRMARAHSDVIWKSPDAGCGVVWCVKTPVVATWCSSSAGSGEREGKPAGDLQRDCTLATFLVASRKQLMRVEKGFVLAQELKVQPVRAGKAWRQEGEASGLTAATGREWKEA